MNYKVEKSTLSGSMTVPTSKSHTMRAILLASMAEGVSLIRNALPSPDTSAMIAVCSALGAKIRDEGDCLTITGTAGCLSVPDQVLDVGNSGQALRFGAAMAARLPLYSIFTGDASIRSIRPMNPLLVALEQLGAFAVSSKSDGHAPVVIRGPVRPGQVLMDGRDSQPVSAILMLAAFMPGTTRIRVRNPGEKPWMDLTLYWLDKIGVSCINTDYTDYVVHGLSSTCPAFEYTVPGDWSSAAFPVAAAILTNSSIQLENMDSNDPQGDKLILDIFTRMGARLCTDAAAKTVTVHPHEGLRGITVDVNSVIDALPVLAAVAAFASTPTTITGGGIARHKESDRIAAISAELGKMGAVIEEFPDGMTIYPSTMHGAVLNSRNDHRVAMALTVAGLACGNTLIRDVACVGKSFPAFAHAMRAVGAQIAESD